MTDLDLPPGWIAVSKADASTLAGATGGVAGLVIARDTASDDLLVQGDDGELWLVHPDWQGDATRHLIRDVSDLVPPAQVDAVSIWVTADACGLLLAQHDGDQNDLSVLRMPRDGAVPETLARAAELGWQQILGPFEPVAQTAEGGRLTGQTLTYHARPIIDDFVLICVTALPGEPLTLRQILPEVPAQIEFHAADELNDFLRGGLFVPVTGTMDVGFGLSAIAPEYRP